MTIKPVVAVTLGDPAGIGPELVAKLMARRDVTDQATVVLVGDPWLWEEGQRVAGMRTPMRAIGSLAEARGMGAGGPLFLAVDSGVMPDDGQYAAVSAVCGASVLRVLTQCMDAASASEVDAICFAPLNKHAMKLGGLKFEDELHFFADHLGVSGYFCEFNTLGTLWTSRISSHVPLADVVKHLDKDRVKAAAKLIYHSVQAAGLDRPRVAVAALNPHGGDGGTCGREEIDIIAPAVREMNEEGFPIVGPYPADTIFLKARAGELDAIVTMFHDQGQIAIKLMGFEKGVTVQGGLPIPITTPAHGTAFDIAGQNKANVEATIQAFLIAGRMGASFAAQRSSGRPSSSEIDE